MCYYCDIAKIKKSLFNKYIKSFSNNNKLIDGCNNIEYIPCDKHLKSLYIRHCGKISILHPPIIHIKELFIENYEILPSLKSLSLLNCPNITTIPSMPKLKKLYLFNCNNLIFISNMPNLKKLIISNCKNLLSISNLTKMKELDIYNCQKISYIPKIDGLKKIKLYNCNSIKSIPKINSLKKINVKFCKYVNTTGPFLCY